MPNKLQTSGSFEGHASCKPFVEKCVMDIIVPFMTNSSSSSASLDHLICFLCLKFKWNGWNRLIILLFWSNEWIQMIAVRWEFGTRTQIQLTKEDRQIFCEGEEKDKDRYPCKENKNKIPKAQDEILSSFEKIPIQWNLTLINAFHTHHPLIFQNKLLVNRSKIYS